MTARCCEPLHIETAAGRRVQHTCGAKFRQPWQPVEAKR